MHVLGNKETSIPENCRIKIQKLPRKPYPASFINLITKEDISSTNVEHLLILCKKKYKGQLLKKDMKIYVQFYGKDVWFIIKHISFNCSEESVLADQLSELNIKNNPIEEPYFLVVESTNWEISLNTEKNINSIDHKIISFNRFGGYKEIKQELLRAVGSVLENNECRKYYYLKVLTIYIH